MNFNNFLDALFFQVLENSTEVEAYNLFCGIIMHQYNDDARVRENRPLNHEALPEFGRMISTYEYFFHKLKNGAVIEHQLIPEQN